MLRNFVAPSSLHRVLRPQRANRFVQLIIILLAGGGFFFFTTSSESIKLRMKWENRPENGGSDVYPSCINRTSPNTTLVIYNRAGKSGSSTLLAFIRALRKVNQFSFSHSLDFRNRELNVKKQTKLLKKLSRLTRPTVFDRHLLYLDFQTINVSSPAYINLVRDPVEREISSFFYNRSKPHWNTLKRLYKDKLVKPTDEWLQRNISEAIVDENDEYFGLMRDGARRISLVTYFCGQQSFCKEHNNKQALQQAKLHVESVYSVVGVLELLEDSLTVYEAYLPRFFRGIVNLYKKRKRVHYNVGKNKKMVTEEAKRRLKDLTSPDQELYEFIRERLQRQIQCIGT